MIKLNFKYLLCLTIFIYNVQCIPPFFMGRPKEGLVPQPQPNSEDLSQYYRINPHWIEQKLDHFNESNTAVWKQVCEIIM